MDAPKSSCCKEEVYYFKAQSSSLQLYLIFVGLCTAAGVKPSEAGTFGAGT